MPLNVARVDLVVQASHVVPDLPLTATLTPDVLTSDHALAVVDART